MRIFAFLIVLFLITPLIAKEITEQQKQEILANVENCVKNVASCNCTQFPEQGVSYCEKMTSGALACLRDFKAPACQDIDPTKVMIQGKSIKQIVEKIVQSYDKQITDCVNNENCDCSQFPQSVQELCADKIQKQKDCLESYDLEACNELENPNVKIFPDFTPQWIVNILDPIIRPLIKIRQENMRNFAIGSAMNSIGICFSDPYNCDCSSIKYATIRADCEQRARLMRTCLEYRDCAITGNETCTGIESCNDLTNMPLVPEVTPGFMKPFIEPVVLKFVCPMMKDWPYDKGNYASCK